MKKKQLIALALVGILCLTGCKANDTSETQSNTEPDVTTSPTEPPVNTHVTPISENLYNISLPITLETTYSDD